jgi:tetratricopeptide (TPR) repeat protein
MIDSIPQANASTELTGRAEFGELLLLLKYAPRAAFIFALYNHAGAREEVVEAVRRAIAPTPVFTWTYAAESPYPISYLDRLTEEQQRQRAIVFFFDMELGDDKAWKSLDHTREYFGNQPHALIFWVTPAGRVDAGVKAPHFWAQRSAVFDFTIEQPEPRMELRDKGAGAGMRIEDLEDAKQQLRLYRGLLDEYRELPNVLPATLADLNGKVAWLLDYLGRSEEALPFLHEALALYEQLGDAQGKAATLSMMAELIARQGEVKQALELWRQSLALYEQIGDARGKAAALANMKWLAER